MDELVAFEDVMILLRATSEQVDRLIAAGKLRPRTVEGKQKFAMKEVEALRAMGESVELPSWLEEAKPLTTEATAIPAPKARPARKVRRKKKAAPKKKKPVAKKRRKR